MKQSTFRLTFIDVIRAYAICMMLQGHFIDGLLNSAFRSADSVPYVIWEYFRGMTAPIFFTVSGFIFMYLLVKETKPGKTGWNHIRVQKGIRRGLTLIATAYFLRSNIFNILLSEYKDMNFRLVDVLHCMGFALFFMIAIYLFSYKKSKWLAPTILGFSTLIIFLFAPVYSKLSYNYLPVAIANYFTTANGSVFTLFPWFGYSAFGALMGTLFNINKDNTKVYEYAIAFSIALGLILSFGSKPFFAYLYGQSGLYLAKLHTMQFYIFHRLGNVFLVFAFFMLLRNVITSKKIQTIGQNTLSIYVIHYIILYGSFTGIGLYRFLHNGLNPYFAVCGALLFIFVVLYLSRQYNNNKEKIDEIKAELTKEVKIYSNAVAKQLIKLAVGIKNRVLLVLTIMKFKG